MTTHKLLQLGDVVDEKSKLFIRCVHECGYKPPVYVARSSFAIEGTFFSFIFHKKKTVTDVFYEKLRNGLKPNEEFNRIYRNYLQQYAADKHS